MSARSNPYRAAGTFAGPSYTERQADQDLLRSIRQNQRFPYVLAPRQSGKSSLIQHVRGQLRAPEFRTAFVDFSTFTPEEIHDLSVFQRRFFEDCRRSLDLPDPLPPVEQFLDGVEALLDRCPGARLVIILDEVDALLPCPFKDTFFSILRNAFNERAQRPALERVQFVLSGAARPEELISDRLRSPFNVGEAIVLRDLTRADTARTCEPFARQTGASAEALAEAVYVQTSGSVYLTQLILEKLWERFAGKAEAGAMPVDWPEEVEEVADAVVAGAARDIHFENIQSSLRRRPEALRVYRTLLDSGRVSGAERELLWFTGLAPREGFDLYRNRIYERVFQARGPLDQVTAWRRQRALRRVSAMAAAVVIGLGMFFALRPNRELAAFRAFSQLGASVENLSTNANGTVERAVWLNKKYSNSDQANAEARRFVDLCVQYENVLNIRSMSILDYSGGIDRTNAMTILPSLEKLTALTFLFLRCPSVQKLPGLEKLTTLTSLVLSFTQVKELPGMERLTALTHLDLSFTQVRDLPGLEKLTALTHLDLSGTPVQELRGLERLTGLIHLDLYRTQVKKLPGLEKLTALKQLGLSGTPVQELPGLEKLTALTNLDLRGTLVQELPGLEKLAGLTSLNLKNTPIQKLSGLEKLTALTELGLSYTQVKVEELPDLTKLPFLENLYLVGTPISIKQQAELRRKHPKVKFYFTEEDYRK